MTANELFSKMEERFGKYPDCGVVCSNEEDIKSAVFWGTSFNISITASEREGGHGSPTTMI